MAFEVAGRLGTCIVQNTQMLPWLLPTASNWQRGCMVMSVRYLKKPPSRTRPLPSKLQDWRREQGQPVNPTSRGVLTDRPDFSYCDGRPVPPGQRQNGRAVWQRQTMETIVQLISEVDLAEKLHAERELHAEQQRQQEVRTRLRAKGTEALEPT